MAAKKKNTTKRKKSAGKASTRKKTARTKTARTKKVRGKRKSKKRAKPKSKSNENSLAFRSTTDAFALANKSLHIYGKDNVCLTNSKGRSNPGGRSPAELVVDASEGFVPLWAQCVTLRWRFNEGSFMAFANPRAAKDAIRQLWGEAILAWGEAAPVKFTEEDDAWDFEIVVRSSDNCSVSGCTLARAFFPDAGRHEMVLYPKMFQQPREEQVDTLIHELGHVFGLRHFFANVSETAWPSAIFGTHSPFTIMNYGADSFLTEQDKSDLASLYSKVWSGELTQINKTRIVQVRPYHELGMVNAIANANPQYIPMPMLRNSYYG